MQKSRQVSLTPTLQEFNWDLFSCRDWNSKKQHKYKKAQVLTPPTQFAYVALLHPPRM